MIRTLKMNYRVKQFALELDNALSHCQLHESFVSRVLDIYRLLKRKCLRLPAYTVLWYIAHKGTYSLELLRASSMINLAARQHVPHMQVPRKSSNEYIP